MSRMPVRALCHLCHHNSVVIAVRGTVRLNAARKAFSMSGASAWRFSASSRDGEGEWDSAIWPFLFFQNASQVMRSLVAIDFAVMLPKSEA
jgi:hypothetical protein